MLKIFSAALLATSVIAAPALAATTGKTTATPAPVIKAEQTKSKTMNAPDNAKTGATKALNANAKLVHQHVRRHHRHHKMVSLKGHSTVGVKQTAPANTKKPG